MELKDNKEIVDLIKFLGRGIKKHGLKVIIKTLQKVDLVNANTSHLDIIDFIETSICSKYNVLRAGLYKDNTRGDTTIARKLCVLFLRKHLHMSDEEIGRHYNRTRQTLYQIKSDFNKLDAKNKVDIVFINTYNEFDAKIQEYISEIKSETQTNNQNE